MTGATISAAELLRCADAEPHIEAADKNGQKWDVCIECGEAEEAER